jgi:hypothetical protein
LMTSHFGLGATAIFTNMEKAGKYQQYEISLLLRVFLVRVIPFNPERSNCSELFF